MFINLVTAFAVTLFFSCQDASSSLHKYRQRNDGPSSEGEGILLKYTDSGKVVATLKTPYLKEFGINNFPYEEFPDGIAVTFVDDEGKENYIYADYALRYKPNNLIDLRDNVVLILNDSTTLKTSQLFWDQKNKWIFTDQPYTVRFPEDDSFNHGEGFDSDQDFEIFLSLNNQSRIYVNETAQNTDSIP